MGARLQDSFKPRRGMAQLKMKQRKHKQTLRDIARNMNEYYKHTNEYYKHTPVKVNLAPSITDIAVGILGLASLVYLTAQRAKPGV